MAQYSFDFALKVPQEDKELQKWVEQHNQHVLHAARSTPVSPGSFLSALDRGEAKANAVYLLRGVLYQHLRKSAGAGPLPSKSGFLQALRGEMAVKKTAQDPAFTVRHTLIKTHTIR